MLKEESNLFDYAKRSCNDRVVCVSLVGKLGVCTNRASIEHQRYHAIDSPKTTLRKQGKSGLLTTSIGVLH